MNKAKAVARLACLVLALAPRGGSGQTAHSQHGVVRGWDDPACGARWLLVRDAAHPGGPGRMFLAAPVKAGLEADGDPLVVHAGDRVIVEAHSRAADARLEAVALGSARRGERFRARLRLGGKIVDAEALGTGFAAFAPEKQVMR